MDSEEWERRAPARGRRGSAARPTGPRAAGGELPRLVKILERPAGQQFSPFQGPLESAIAVGYVFQFSRRNHQCKENLLLFPAATSYLSPSARCAPVNGLAGCYVSTIGKPHEYFDLTGSSVAFLLVFDALAYPFEVPPPP